MKKNHPKLTLVGAGPGDPELITIKGVRVLQAADVVLYDALVDPELLHYAPNAEHIPVGKRAGRSSVSQETINRLIVEKAISRGHVVRLKGGDPFVFARGSEEVSYAQRFGIETDVVIGISSVMLPGYYGIPLTCRGVNQSFSVVTATTSEGKLSNEVIHAAKYAPTAIIFMGLRKLDLIVEAYQLAGKSELPVAVISNGSQTNSMIISGRVNNILQKVEAHNPPAPALLVFGEGAKQARVSDFEELLSVEHFDEKKIA
ncbi:MAG: uroporphyrinogen-III C-methyltransferase [Bacteroidota bacterium]